MMGCGGDCEVDQAHHNDVGHLGQVEDRGLPGDDKDGDLKGELKSRSGQSIDGVENF